ncbi:hypothetical protein K504DRAFT_411618 [Pleomassaria siparia CBS 279.74]|uniref:Polynucleotide 5'-hydroxyl-kinase GRC3 n=1 Tax=Pleomassaria siparia CBS 279.74 TaxID=1314801 RepID=A0A6G1K3H3_9PLEO|nr:hypothetical protein K504DRAFT_411618 [Pleomassaria siparia CBS 279.74]
MPGKRKRANIHGTYSPLPDPGTATIKPISAVAAAKTRLQPVHIDHAPEAVSDLVVEIDASEKEYTEASSDEEAPDIRRNVQMCNWRYQNDNVSVDTDRELTMILTNGEELALIGVFDFVILKGAMNINGANFAASQRGGGPPIIRRAYVPSPHPISIIKGLDDTTQVQFLHCEDEPAPFENISPLFKGIWNERPDGRSCRSFAVIPESDADLLKRALRAEFIPHDWTRQIEDCASNLSTTLICGTPSSGKSNFARRLLNRYLTGHGKLARAIPSIYFLDLDSEKPEYSPHGQISLTLVRETNLGPSFTHPDSIPGSSGANRPIRSHPLKAKNLKDSMDYFIACFEDLFQTYTNLQQRNPSVPLMINTPGWLYTDGFHQLLQILSQTVPRRLVYLGDARSTDEEKARKIHQLTTVVTKNRVLVHELSAVPNLIDPSRTDAELKSMHMLSYFHCTGAVLESGTTKRTYDSRPLSSITPWEFCYEESEDSEQTFIGCLMLSEWVEPQLLFTVLNGSIIQIVETEDENVQDLFGQLPRTNKYRIPYFEKGPNDAVEPLDPRTSRLVCTALLRGWDPETRTAQVLVPKTHEVLLHGLKPEKTVFVFGCCETPEWAYAEDAYLEAAGRGKDIKVGNKMANEAVELPPWIAKVEDIGNMGYMNTARRVRKFQQ